MCLGVDIFELILFWIHSDVLLCGFISFVIFGKFSAIISSSAFSALPSLSFPSRTLMIQMLDL